MEGKALVASKSFWGAAVMLGAIVAKAAGLDIGEQQGWVDALVGAGGFALVLWGRIGAVKPITGIISANPAAVVLLALGAALALSACATVGMSDRSDGSDASDSLAALAQFARDDLQAALEDAQAHSDPAGEQCWGGLLAIMDQGGLTFAKPKGVASAWQLARDIRRGLGTGALRESVNVACAAVIHDARITILKLGILAVGKAMTGGLLP